MIKKALSLIFTALILFTMLPQAHIFADSNNTYYVSVNDGSDSNDGSLAKPFATLKKAVSVMQAGDTCYIRGGIYRETLNVSFSDNKVTTFSAYNDEKVVISACDEITKWSREGDSNIWYANMLWDIYDGAGNMVFQNGELRHEARWPNIPTDYNYETCHPLLDISTYARVENAKTANGICVTDSNMPDTDLAGAYMWCASGVAYWSYFTQINSYDASTKTVTVNDVFDGGGVYYPKANNIYYLTKHKSLLDSEGEWFKNTKNYRLYYYTENSDGPLGIEAKRREYAVKLVGASNVVINGISVYGGKVEFDDATTNSSFANGVVEACDYRYPIYGGRGSASGVMINGLNNKISRCEIKNMYGEGIAVTGSNNRVLNNYVHNVNFEHTYSDGIYITGKNHLISHNTVKYTGRGAIGGRCDACVVSYNDISGASRLSRDTGIVYFNSHDYKNTEWHHNVFHDSINSEGIQLGFYLDSFTTSLIVYNNLFYNLEAPKAESDSSQSMLAINPNSIYNLFINNTFVNKSKVYYLEPVDMSGTMFINNLFRNRAFDANALSNYQVTYLKNLEGEDYWNGNEEGDYTLQAGSKAVDAGTFVAGVNEGYKGKAPDCGAFEYGVEPWKAGHDFNKEYDDEFVLNTKIPYRNLIENSSFENGLSGWDISGTPSTFNMSSWTYFCKMTKAGEFSCLLQSDGDCVSRTISGLKPYTTYEFGGYAQLSGAYTYGFNKIGISTGATSGNPSNMSDGTWVSYRLNFGEGDFDTLCIDMKNPISTSMVTARLDSSDGEVIAEVSFNKKLGASGWVLGEGNLLKEITGEHTVYLCFNGNFGGAELGGIYCDDKTATDTVVLKAVSDSGETHKIISNKKSFKVPALKTIVTTDANGEVTLSVCKNGNILNGYVDSLYLREYYPCEKESTSVTENFDGLPDNSKPLEINNILDAKVGFDYVITDKSTFKRCGVESGTVFETLLGEQLIAAEDGRLKIVKNTKNYYNNVEFDVPITDEGILNISIDISCDEGLPAGDYSYEFFKLTGKAIDDDNNRSKNAAVLTYDSGDLYLLGTDDDFYGNNRTKVPGYVADSVNNIVFTVDFTKHETYVVVNGNKSEPVKSKVSDIRQFILTLLPRNTTNGLYIDNLSFQQYIAESGDIMVAQTGIRNDKYEKIQNIIPGEFNAFELILNNKSGSLIPMTGILGVYDSKGKMTEIMTIDRNIKTYGLDRFAIGLVMPKEPGYTVKLYTWRNINSVMPILECYTFE